MGKIVVQTIIFLVGIATHLEKEKSKFKMTSCPILSVWRGWVKFLCHTHTHTHTHQDFIISHGTFCNISNWILRVHWTSVWSDPQWPGKPGFNSRSSHAKDSKMELDTSLINSIIMYVSRVKWNNPGKEVTPSPASRCSSNCKRSLLVALDYGCQLYLHILHCHL